MGTGQDVYKRQGYGDTIVAESLQQDEFVLICSTELEVIDTDFIFRDQDVYKRQELYYVNGEEAEEDSFKNFFNGVVNISAKERLEETYQADGDPEWKFIFENEDAREEVSYYIFDENFYVAVKDLSLIHI